MRGNDPRCVARSLILRKLRPLSRRLRVTYLHASATLCGSILLLALRPPFPPAFLMSPTHAGPRPQPHALDPQRHPHPHPDPAEIRHPTAGAPCPGPPISGTTPHRHPVHSCSNTGRHVPTAASAACTYLPTVRLLPLLATPELSTTVPTALLCSRCPYPPEMAVVPSSVAFAVESEARIATFSHRVGGGGRRRGGKQRDPR